MSFDLTFYTQKFTKEQVLPLVQKLEKENEIKFVIGEGWFIFDKEGDNFHFEDQEIYVESSVSDFDPLEYFDEEDEGYEEEFSGGKSLKPILSKCNLEIGFCCHGADDIKAVNLFLTILAEVFPDSVLTNHYEGENYTGKEIVTKLREIQEEFED